MKFNTNKGFCLKYFTKMCIYICLTFYMVDASTQSEPTCSKFHYEEQTLKSVVRLEFQMENFKSAMEENQKITKDILDEYKAHQRNHTADVQEMIDKKFKEMENSWERRLQSLKADLGIYKDISFTATTPSTVNPRIGDTIIFTKTMYNSEQSYDTLSGKFKVPVAGTYMFNVQLCLDVGVKFVHYAIMAGSRELTHTLLYDAEQRFCNSATAIVRLTMNEFVYVKVTSTNGHALRDASNEWNTFSGVLLTIK